MLARCSYFELGLPVVEFLETQLFHSEKLSFFRKMETEHSFELSLNICVFYRRISNLEIQNFSLENHMINARHHFVDGWHLLTKGVKPASSPTPYVVDYVTREGGMGGMGDLRFGQEFFGK